jgi:histidyl-tRNA synthetase
MISKKKSRQLFQSIKGMNDILPKDQIWWDLVGQAGRRVAELHNFSFIETPLLESAALFEAGIGVNTDIVEKEMFSFRTKGGDTVALRPEGTAPVMRSYFQHQLGYFSSPLKVFYSGPMFRYERPQAGRERQFHQWGVEIIGDGDPVYDAAVILVCLDFFNEVKLKDIQLKINTLGCRVCRPTYRQKLKDYYRLRKSKLCKDCQRRYDKNAFRLLDCKEEECLKMRGGAPIILDYLCQNCNNHFKSLLEIIEDNNVVYEPDSYLVRGLDYYNRTVFQFHHPSSPQELGGGGRYDYLAELLGGRMIPGVGVALGLERIIDAVRGRNANIQPKLGMKIFWVAVGDQAQKSSLKLMGQLRRAGVIVGENLGRKSLRAQLKAVNRAKVKVALIFGQKEVFEGTIIIRDMETGGQETVFLKNLIEEVRKRLR